MKIVELIGEFRYSVSGLKRRFASCIRRGCGGGVEYGMETRFRLAVGVEIYKKNTWKTGS